MDQVTQQSPAAEILSFPQVSRIDEAMLETVLNNMSQGVLLFELGNTINFLQSTLLGNVRIIGGNRAAGALPA